MVQIGSHTLSLLRIAAALGIFVYHFATLSGNHVAGIFAISIYIFCFLTGYLSYSARRQQLNWFLRRIYSIMIPYWFVIVPALLINRIISYKETSVAKDLISLLGGNLFLDNPVYIIAWYITFVLLLYSFVFMQSLAKNNTQSLLVWLLAVTVFGPMLHMTDFFIVFAIGFLYSKKKPPPPKSAAKEHSLGRALFFLQDKCYAFFLVHGAVLLVLFKSGYASDKFLIFTSGFLFSWIGAVFLREITRPLVVILTNRTESAVIPKAFLPRKLRTL